MLAITAILCSLFGALISAELCAANNGSLNVQRKMRFLIIPVLLLLHLVLPARINIFVIAALVVFFIGDLLQINDEFTSGSANIIFIIAGALFIVAILQSYARVPIYFSKVFFPVIIYAAVCAAICYLFRHLFKLLNFADIAALAISVLLSLFALIALLHNSLSDPWAIFIAALLLCVSTYIRLASKIGINSGQSSAFSKRSSISRVLLLGSLLLIVVGFSELFI